MKNKTILTCEKILSSMDSEITTNDGPRRQHSLQPSNMYPLYCMSRGVVPRNGGSLQHLHLRAELLFNSILIHPVISQRKCLARLYFPGFMTAVLVPAATACCWTCLFPQQCTETWRSVQRSPPRLQVEGNAVICLQEVEKKKVGENERNIHVCANVHQRLLCFHFSCLLEAEVR